MSFSFGFNTLIKVFLLTCLRGKGKSLCFFNIPPGCDSVWPLSGTGEWDSSEEGTEKRNDRGLRKQTKPMEG